MEALNFRILSSLVAILIVAAGCGDHGKSSTTFGEAVANIEVEEFSKLQRGAEQGDAISQYDLGCRYADGNFFAHGKRGATNDFASATKWFRKSADQGNAKAQLDLSALYYVGLGVPKDTTESIRWLRMSAEQGNPTAQFILGGKHDIGDGFPRDPAKAAEWWRKAAEQNDANAQFALGAAYGAGQGVEKDETIAVEWMRKSATQGHYRAQLSLGVRYVDGIGVQQDLVEGFMWLSLGAQGLQQQLEKSSPLKSELSGSEMGAAARKSPNAFFDEAALELLGRLKIEMKPEQIAEAHSRIASYQEKTQTRQ